jgi:hypothetical protein
MGMKIDFSPSEKNISGSNRSLTEIIQCTVSCFVGLLLIKCKPVLLQCPIKGG